MGPELTSQEVAAAIAELHQVHSRATAQLAAYVGHPAATRRAELSDEQELEVLRLTSTGKSAKMFRQGADPLYESDGSVGSEILRLSALGSGASRRGGRLSRSDGDTLALSAGGAGTALVSKYGLGITYAGKPVLDTPENRLRFARVLPSYVTDTTDAPAQDISSWVGRSTGGLGDGSDQSPDMGATDPDFGEQEEEITNPGAVASPAAEVSRLVKAGAAAGITGLRTGAIKSRHPGTGRFTSKQARLSSRPLSGVLSGPV